MLQHHLAQMLIYNCIFLPLNQNYKISNVAWVIKHEIVSALPSIASDLKTSSSLVQFTVLSYAIVSSISAVVGGFVCDTLKYVTFSQLTQKCILNNCQVFMYIWQTYYNYIWSYNFFCRKYWMYFFTYHFIFKYFQNSTRFRRRNHSCSTNLLKFYIF